MKLVMQEFGEWASTHRLNHETPEQKGQTQKGPKEEVTIKIASSNDEGELDDKWFQEDAMANNWSLRWNQKAKSSDGVKKQMQNT